MSGVESGLELYEQTKSMPSTYAAYEQISAFTEDENYKALYEQLRDYGHPRPKTPAYPQLSSSFQQSLENIAISGMDAVEQLNKSEERISYCKKYFKVAFFVPVVMSLAVVSTLWMQIYGPEGIINTFLTNMGFDPQPFIHSADQALPSIAIMSAWQGMGYQMIIFLGGLQAINPALYEAAEMDHASAWKKFKDITLPELKPLCVFVFITVTIGAFRMIVQPMVMTGGGPSNSTYTIVYDIYETGTVNWEIGLASAMAVVFVIFVVVLTIRLDVGMSRLFSG